MYLTAENFIDPCIVHCPPNRLRTNRLRTNRLRFEFMVLPEVFPLRPLPHICPAVVRAFRLHIVLIILLLVPACASNRDTIAAGLPAPDSAFITGTATGYSVYIWECYRDRRIVIFYGSAEFTKGAYQRQEALCGETTPIEKESIHQPKRELDPKQFWK